MINNKIQASQEDYELAVSNGYTGEMAPYIESNRPWSMFNYFALWMGSVHNVPNYVAVGGFLFLGMAPIHVIAAIILSSFGVMALLTLNGMAGYQYGIPSTLVLRNTYGSKGAKLPGFLRGIVAAIMWYGLQTYAGSQALLILIGKIFPGFISLGGGAKFLGITLPGLITFIIFWAINLGIGLGGGKTISKFTTILNPIIYLVFGGMLIWAIKVGGGLGGILSYNSGIQMENSRIFIYLMIISSVMSVWAAPGISSSDFARNAKNTKDLALGQGLGLFVAYLLFAFSSVCILVGATIHYGTGMWNVLDIIEKWDSLVAIIFALGTLLMTTISTNATGNIIPAGYQIATLTNGKFTFKKGVVIASIISFAICPWKLMENQDSIYLFLDIIGAIMGPVAGTMIAHHFFVAKQKIDLKQIYGKEQGLYKNGINKVAYISTITGALISIALMFIPALSDLGNVSWFISFIISFGIYLLLGPKDLK